MLIVLFKKVGVQKTEASRIPQNFLPTCMSHIKEEKKLSFPGKTYVCSFFFFFFPILQAVNSSSEFNCLGAFQVG